MTNSTFTLDDLERILLAASGAPDGIDRFEDVRDVEFDALGYDSVALLETTSRVQREFGVTIDESALSEARTPQTLVNAVNAQMDMQRLG